MRRLLASAATAVVLSSVLTGCASSSPEAELQSRSNDVVAAANAGDATALRTAAGRMLEEIKKQNNAGDLTTSKARTLQVLLARISANAGDLEAAEEPSPEPSTEEPSPVESPSPEPSPEPSPSEEPSPEPSPVEEPPSPEPVPSLLSPAPLQAGQTSPQPSP